MPLQRHLQPKLQLTMKPTSEDVAHDVKLKARNRREAFAPLAMESKSNFDAAIPDVQGQWRCHYPLSADDVAHLAYQHLQV